MNREKILGRWLMLVALGQAAIGLLIPVLAYTSAFDGYGGLLQAAFWAGQNTPPQAMELQRWMFALFGPVITSVGILMYFLVRAGIRHRDTSAWNGLLIVSAIWAVGDIGISLMHDFWLHVYLDVFAILIVVPPVLVLRAGSKDASFPLSS